MAGLTIYSYFAVEDFCQLHRQYTWLGPTTWTPLSSGLTDCSWGMPKGTPSSPQSRPETPRSTSKWLRRWKWLSKALGHSSSLTFKKEEKMPVSVGDIVVFAKLSYKMKAGSSPLRVAKVSSIREDQTQGSVTLKTSPSLD